VQSSSPLYSDLEIRFLQLENNVKRHMSFTNKDALFKDLEFDEKYIHRSLTGPEHSGAIGEGAYEAWKRELLITPHNSGHVDTEPNDDKDKIEYNSG